MPADNCHTPRLFPVSPNAALCLGDLSPISTKVATYTSATSHPVHTCTHKRAHLSRHRVQRAGYRHICGHGAEGDDRVHDGVLLWAQLAHEPRGRAHHGACGRVLLCSPVHVGAHGHPATAGENGHTCMHMHVHAGAGTAQGARLSAQVKGGCLSMRVTDSCTHEPGPLTHTRYAMPRTRTLCKASSRRLNAHAHTHTQRHRPTSF